MNPERHTTMGAENRKHLRAPLLATAVLHEGPRPIGSFRVVNASAGGLLLVGAPPAGRDRVGVLLRLPGDRLVRCEATIVREEVQSGRPVFAVAFSELRADQERLIDEAVTLALDEARTASVLLLVDDIDLTQALRDAIARLGYRSFPVASLREVIHALERPNNFSLALVDDALSRQAGGSAAKEVLDHLAARHPAIRRVLLVDAGGEARQGQELLPKPWTESRLAQTLAASPTVKVSLLPDI
jgi:hypothetical protein